MENFTFLKYPNLPEKAVRLCAVSQKADFVRCFLKERGIEVYPIKENPVLPAPCSAHGDMRLCYLGEGKILTDCRELARELEGLGLSASVPERKPRGGYPGDAVLNVLFLGKRLFCRTGTSKRPGAAEEILRCAGEKGIPVYPVRQGYTRCSVCVVGENAVITADPSLEKTAEQAGVEVLRICPGFIRLPGYEYGFIGGCTGLLGPKLLAVCGRLESHPDGKRMEDFAAKHGVEILSIPTPDGMLWDVGGIIPLAEEKRMRL